MGGEDGEIETEDRVWGMAIDFVVRWVVGVVVLCVEGKTDFLLCFLRLSFCCSAVVAVLSAAAEIRELVVFVSEKV